MDELGRQYAKNIEDLSISATLVTNRTKDVERLKELLTRSSQQLTALLAFLRQEQPKGNCRGSGRDDHRDCPACGASLYVLGKAGA